MIKLMKYLKPFMASIFAIIALLFIQAMTDLALPEYIANIVNDGIAKSNTAFIFQEGRSMLFVALLGAVCTVVVGFLAAKVAEIGRAHV